MSDTNSNHELLLRHLDGRLSADEEACVAELLRTDAEARAFLREVAEQAVAVAELERNEKARRGELDMRIVPSSGSRIRFNDWRWITAIAAAVMLLAGGSFWWMRSMPEPAQIAEMSGPLQWTGAGGQVVRDLKIGNVVSGGTLESLSVESSVAFKFRDGTQVTIFGPAAVTIPAQKQKVLDLRSGNLSANVAPQPEARPLVVHTPAADLTVMGTQFNVKADAAYTSLSVNEGRVSLRRLVDGRIAEVPAHHRVVASIDQRAELLATQPSPPVNHWSSNLPAGAAYGKWQMKDDGLAGCLRAEPLFLKETKFGPLLLFVTAISVSSGNGPPVLLGRDTRFRIRGRMPAGGDVSFGMTTHFPNGGCSGKYSTSRRIESGGLPDGGFDLELRLADIPPEEPRSPRTAAGLTIEDCWLLSVHADKGLELVSVEVLPN